MARAPRRPPPRRESEPPRRRYVKVARASGRSEAELARAQALQRRAQFFLDFVEAENSMGFHAPQEAARILGESVNFSRQGQVAMRDRMRR
jgi:nitrite reductase (cytochrome c-552)